MAVKMKQDCKKDFQVGAGMLTGFVLWTMAVCCVDVQAIGPRGSNVGFAGINSFFHNLTGVHMFLYTLTDWLSLIPLAVVAGFGLLGLAQWIRRKQLWKVDRSILILGGFYLVVMAVYLFFEIFAVNYRPVLIDGRLEVSYPSSTTMLVMCVVPTAVMELRDRMKNIILKQWVTSVLVVFSVFMIVGRLISGVHWLTDIIGGILLSGGLVWLYLGIRHMDVR
jgi:undecaprenyl-diphosphatase